MVVVWVCVRLGLSLSASLVAMSSWSLVAVLMFVGLVLLWSSCIHVWRVVSISFSSLLMSSWASGPRVMFHSVVLLICSSSAICWFVQLGKVVMRCIAFLVSAVFLVFVVVRGLGCSMYCLGVCGLYLLTFLDVWGFLG